MKKKWNIAFILVFFLFILSLGVGVYQITGNSIFDWIFGGSQQKNSFISEDMPVRCEDLSLMDPISLTNTFFRECKSVGFHDLNKKGSNDLFQTRVSLREVDGKRYCYVDNFLNKELTSFCILDNNNHIVVESRAIKYGCEREKKLCNKMRKLKDSLGPITIDSPGLNDLLKILQNRCKCSYWQNKLKIGNAIIKSGDCKSAFYIGRYNQFGNMYNEKDLINELNRLSVFSVIIGGFNGSCMFVEKLPSFGVKCFGGFHCSSLNKFKNLFGNDKACCSYTFGSKAGTCGMEKVLECISNGGTPQGGVCKESAGRGVCVNLKDKNVSESKPL